MHSKSIFILIIIGFCICASSFGQTGVPVLKQRITDQAGILNQSEVRDLDERLSQFEKETSTQIAVLIISSLDGADLADYTYRVAEENHLGKKGNDNGVLLLVAMEERDIRIEVGYGLEGALTDVMSGRIIRNEIAPKFRSGDYYKGLLSGITAIMEATKGEYKGETEKEVRKISPIVIFIIIIIVAMIMRRLLTSSGHYVGSGKYKDRFPWWWGGFGGGGFGSGGFGGGGFGSGGGFGGGGFSGGGGRFGGGGASGGW
jgi:uncharacterized protein